MASLFKPIDKNKAVLSSIKLKENRQAFGQEELKLMERELFQGVGTTPMPPTPKDLEPQYSKNPTS